MPLQLIPSDDIDRLLSLLREADEDPARIRAALIDPTNTPYLFQVDGQVVGVALMHWHPHESELIYIVVDPVHRGQGYGQAALKAIFAVGAGQGVEAVIVGTATTSVENIIFYQKCGFRMDSIRKNFFDYFPTPVYEHGIQMRDMVVFRRQLR